MPGFLIDLQMPFDPTDRLDDFLCKATASKMQDDAVVQAAIYRIQGYLRDRQPSIDRSRHAPMT
jgi:hypothetical protein